MSFLPRYPHNTLSCQAIKDTEELSVQTLHVTKDTNIHREKQLPHTSEALSAATGKPKSCHLPLSADDLTQGLTQNPKPQSSVLIA